MVSPFNCIAAKKNVSPARKQELLEAFETRRNMRPDLSAEEIAESMADEFADRVSRTKRNYLRQIQKQAGIMDRVNRETSFQGRQNAREAHLVMQTDREIPQDVQSVEAAQIWYHRQGVSLMNEAILQTYRGALGLSRASRKLTRDIGRELTGESTGNARAAGSAKKFREALDFMLDNYRRQGVRMGRIEGYLPTEHNSVAIRSLSADEWIGKIRPRLNRAQMVNRDTGEAFTEDELNAVLREVHEDIATGGFARRQPGQPRRYKPFVDRVGDEQFFRWNSFDDWQAYQKEFGNGGDLALALQGYMTKASRDLALLDVLGPDPEATARSLGDQAQQDAAVSRIAASPEDTRFSDRIQHRYDVVAGRTGMSGDSRWAARMETVTNVMTSTSLGSTVMAAVFTDSNFQRMGRQLAGMKIARQLPQYLDSYLSLAAGRGGSTSRNALKLGMSADYWLAGLHGTNRFLGELDGARWSHVAADFSMRFSQLSQVTQAGRQAFGFEFRARLAEELPNNWADMDGRFRSTLEHYGVNEADWNRLKQAPEGAFDTHRGLRILDTIGLGREFDGEISQKLTRAIETEALTATPAASANTRALLTRGTRPGTVQGSFVRQATQWWNWPISVWQGQLSRRFHDPSFTKASKIVQATDYAISTMIMGMIATQGYQLAAGKDPMPFFTPDGSFNWQLVLRGAVYGGSFGLLGDVLFRDYNSYGPSGGLASFAAGPVLTNAGQGLYDITAGAAMETAEGGNVNYGRRVVRTVKNNMPLQSTWFMRAAMERMVFDRLQEWVDPEAHSDFSRRIRSAQREGQGYFFRPGEDLPQRAPDIEGITQ